MIRIKLKEFLTKRGETLHSLSQREGIRYATLWNMSHDQVDLVNLDILDRICTALDCTPGDLLQQRKRSTSRRKVSQPKAQNKKSGRKIR